MALTKQQKTNIISELQDKLSSPQGLVFVNFSHLSASDLSELRQKAKEQNCLFKVVKKTLIRLASQKQSWWNEIGRASCRERV